MAGSVPVDSAATRAPDPFERWACELDIGRTFWLIFATFVTGEGVLGFLAILFVSFLLAATLAYSLYAATLCGWTALAGLALIRRRWLSTYARVSVVEALCALFVLLFLIWVPGTEGGAWDNVHGSVVVGLLATLAISAQRLWFSEWTRSLVKRGVFAATAVSIVAISFLGIAAIWGWWPAEADRAVAAFSLLAIVGFVLTPILRRALARQTDTVPRASPTAPSPVRRSRLTRVGWLLAVVGALVLAPFVIGLVAGIVSDPSSSPGDPSEANVIDSNVFWSPDSRMIAFDRSDYGPPGDTPSGASDIFVASSEGRGLRRLTQTPQNETVLGWLSGPLRIVYARGGTNVYALELKGGAPVLLGKVRASDQPVALSHDGRRLLVSFGEIDSAAYALVDLARGVRTTLPGGGAWGDGAWSPDDSMLAYVTGDGIVVLRDGRVHRRIGQSGSGGLAWSPEGRRLVFSDGGDYGSLWLVQIGDRVRTRLTGGGDTSDLSPAWSPDGSAIYYRHGSFGDHDGLRAMAPDGTRDRMITEDDWAGGGLFEFEAKGDRWLDLARISPDGTRIAYLLGERGDWKNWSLVGVMNADGSHKRPVLE